MAESFHDGEIRDNQHYFCVQVYLEETDAGGIVYHSNYLKYMERARHSFLKLLGISHKDMMNGPNPAMFAVKALSVDYMKPAVLDDQLEIQSHLHHLGGASFTLDQKVMRDQGEICVARVKIALLDAQGRPARMEKALSRKLEDLLGESRG